ncbi:MAG: 5-formyltetrahydrofolate cyclo-ligase [Gammaproteobacteria bacterium]
MTATLAAYSDLPADSPTAEKRFWRRQTLAARRNLPAAARQTASAALCRRIIALPAFAAARRVAAFAPLEDEVNIWPVIENCWQNGKTVALPRVRAWTGREMSFHAVSSRRGLEESRRGILQPPADFPIIAPHLFDFVIVPAAAADSRGYRLGYGGGFYDTFIPLARAATTCAPIFGCQCIDRTPVEPHDQQIDFIFSE